MPADIVYRWLMRPGATARLTPPWTSLVVAQPGVPARGGSRIAGRIGRGPGRGPWVLERGVVLEGRIIEDRQVTGPFSFWTHRQSIEPTGPDGCRLTDRIEYALPAGLLGSLGTQWLPTRLARAFHYRHQTISQDLADHLRHAGQPRLRVAVTGAGGLIGRNLTAFLSAAGHDVRPVVRTTPGDRQIGWNPAAGTIDRALLEGVDAVIHLAGENIAAHRWTPSRREAIRASRSSATRLLAETLAGLERPPRLFLSASAVGLYGDRGEELMTESSPAGTGFLAEVCRAWEAATAPAAAAGVRVLTLRFGVVLTPAGGALARMLPAFRAGLAGRLGSGRQWLSWIGIDDVLGAINHLLFATDPAGPVNMVAGAVRNAEFTRSLASVLHRPAVLPVPAPLLRLAVGGLADEGLLASTRVDPGFLRETGYRYRHGDLATALPHLLGRERS